METGWLIEKLSSSGNLTSLCVGLEECLKQKWTIAGRAIRFARKQDAEAYMATHLKNVKCIAIEHQWD